MTKEELKNMLAKQLRIDVNTIRDDSNLVTDLGADSIDLVEMLMLIEEHFGITITDEDALTLKTVRDVENYIEENA